MWRVDGRGIPGDERGADDRAVAHLQHAERAVLVFHRELPARIGRDEIDFACREIRDVGRAAEAETVRLLRLLAVEPEPRGQDAPIFQLEIDLDLVRAGHREAQLLGVAAHLVVIDREAGAQDDVVQPVQRGAAEVELLRLRRERRGGGERATRTG